MVMRRKSVAGHEGCLAVGVALARVDVAHKQQTFEEQPLTVGLQQFLLGGQRRRLRRDMRRGRASYGRNRGDGTEQGAGKSSKGKAAAIASPASRRGVLGIWVCICDNVALMVKAARIVQSL
ncbi:hypothetical protein X773_25120 [Mesorhizobium sp. LSJC285A00]|nr:hypothetical protein X773_25120 [Mesorhizobium sp. LSJC285A00]